MGMDPTANNGNGAPRLRLREIISNLAAVAVSPRPTIRKLLASPDERVALALVLLATLSHFLLDDEFRNLEQAVRATQPALGALITFVWLVAGALLTIALFFVFSFAVTWIGRLFGGIATPRETRVALAWGTAPLVWSLLWVIPARLFFIAIAVPDAFREAILGHRNPGDFIATKTVAVVIVGLFVAMLEIAVVTWTTVVTSQCLGEANRFSSWRGFGTFVISIVIPGVLLIGSVVTFAAILKLASSF